MIESLEQTEVLSFVKEVGLRYVQDSQEGIFRKRAGRGFFYIQKSKRVKSDKTLTRIRSLVIPPAWNNVWICQYENGHLQATGRDARGRKQYRYHSEWSRARNENKFDKLLHFGKALPSIRKRIQQDLSEKKYTKQKILASVVAIMESTCIRIGNDIYAQENDSYGLTTILNEHVTVRGADIQFRFRGKSGVFHDTHLLDPQISKIVRHCQDLPGEELFAYRDTNGVVHDIGSSDINEYLHEITHDNITAKDFRTWSGSVKALEEVVQCGPLIQPSTKAYKKRQVEVIAKVAEHLRNTVAVCRKYYVHPIIFKADEEGLLCTLKKKASAKKSPLLKPTEALLMAILEQSPH